MKPFPDRRFSAHPIYVIESDVIPIPYFQVVKIINIGPINPIEIRILFSKMKEVNFGLYIFT